MEKRLQAVLAEAGLCSRRKAEEWILAGRVTVDGVPALLGMKVNPDRDRIEVDGEAISSAEPKQTIVLHKPEGYVTTLSDEKGRETVASLVKDAGERLFPVGRLDLNSSGLLLMTNEGDLAYALTHPSHEVPKEYHVRVSGDAEAQLERLNGPMEIDGRRICPASVRLLRKTPAGGVLSVIIHEGKNRQVRKMCAACGLTVRRLKRVSVGEIRLGDLPPGKWRRLTKEERRYLDEIKNAKK